MTPEAAQRFWEKVDTSGECWLWRPTYTIHGYGVFRVGGAGSKRTTAHRVSYALAYGDPGKEMVVDHVCHNDTDCEGGDECLHRRCVNPSHLRAVTRRENVLASHLSRDKRTRCTRGHEYDEENTCWLKNGNRACKECKRQWQREYMERKKAI